MSASPFEIGLNIAFRMCLLAKRLLSTQKYIPCTRRALCKTYSPRRVNAFCFALSTVNVCRGIVTDLDQNSAGR
jgi:hypothetical protein